MLRKAILAGRPALAFFVKAVPPVSQGDRCKAPPRFDVTFP